MKFYTVCHSPLFIVSLHDMKNDHKSDRGSMFSSDVTNEKDYV